MFFHLFFMVHPEYGVIEYLKGINKNNKNTRLLANPTGSIYLFKLVFTRASSLHPTLTK